MADPGENGFEDAHDRAIVELDPGGPVELTALTESFAGLARFYERHYRQDKELAPKLFVTKLESGSIVAEIAPYAVMFGALITTMGAMNTMGDFVRRVNAALRSFSDPPRSPVDQVPVERVAEPVSKDDAEDLAQFVRPLTGKAGARLGLKHARFEKRDGPKHILIEYNFDEAAINRAAINIENALNVPVDAPAPQTIQLLPRGRAISEVMLFFDQASQKPGRPHGRTADRGVIPDISKDALPIYFLHSLQHLKDQMIKGEVNPFKTAFVVDVMVQEINGKPRAYTITHVRDLIPIDDDGGPLEV